MNLDEIATEALRGASRPMPAVRLSIPRDHPKADKLLRLAESLSRFQTLSSGIMVERPMVREDAVDVFLDALRDIIGGEVFDCLMAALDEKIRQAKVAYAAEAKTAMLKNPNLMHSALRALGSAGLLSGMNPSTVSEFFNAASDGAATFGSDARRAAP